MVLAILFRFNAKIGLGMPLFRILDQLCSRFIAAKLPPAQILRLRIIA